MVTELKRSPGRPRLTLEQIAERTTQKCSRCKVTLPLSEFNFDGTRTLGVTSRCKSCIKGYNTEYRTKNATAKKARDAEYYALNAERIKIERAEYREENREAHNQCTAEWLRKNPEKAAQYKRDRRARKAGVVHVPYTFEQLVQRLSMWGGLCWICLERPFETVDHVKPISKGGAEMLSNLRPACRSCNAAKGDKWPYVRKVR